MISRIRSQRRAQALQTALERYQRVLADGTDPSAAKAEIAEALGSDAAVFAIAAHLGDARAHVSAPAPSKAFAARLRAERVPAAPKLVWRPRLSFAPLAAAAAITVFAVLLIPAFSSLPGDTLYALKTASENTRVLIASGPGEARVRIELAKERFDEVDALISRAQNQALGVGTMAAGAPDIDDPEIAGLVATTLQRAGEQIVNAAQILIAEPGATTTDLDELVAVSRQGQEVAENAAVQLPNVEPPARKTVTTLERVEAQAEAVRRLAVPVTTPGPCATPTPSPDPAATPTPTPTATPTPVAGATPTPSPTATPVPTPCISPSPSPTSQPASEPATSPEPLPAPTENTAGASEGSSDDGNGQDVASVQGGDERVWDVQTG
ncbi:MAG: hypothetical protein WD646_08635 [Actinomycetota bacterium]